MALVNPELIERLLERAGGAVGGAVGGSVGGPTGRNIGTRIGQVLGPHGSRLLPPDRRGYGGLFERIGRSANFLDNLGRVIDTGIDRLRNRRGGTQGGVQYPPTDAGMSGGPVDSVPTTNQFSPIPATNSGGAMNDELALYQGQITMAPIVFVNQETGRALYRANPGYVIVRRVDPASGRTMVFQMLKPIARKLGYWKPKPRPLLTASEAKAIRTAARVKNKLERHAKKSGLYVTKTRPRRK